MFVQLWIMTAVTWQLSAARSFHPDLRILSVAESNRLTSWTESDKQNIWELSGQYEGDMVLSANQRNGLIDTNFRWPNKEIPYEIDSAFSDAQKDWIIHSLTEYNNKTCIKPRPRNKNDKDYVYVTGEASGCWSYVGRIEGRQDLNLQLNEPGTGCLRLGTVVHEFLHALGFYHQHSATNRDDYVEIIWQNIQEGREYNFDKYSSNETQSFGEAYDYGSVMHYSAFAFSKNGEKTIVPKDVEAELGQRTGLSETDATKLNKMYGCE